MSGKETGKARQRRLSPFDGWPSAIAQGRPPMNGDGSAFGETSPPHGVRQAGTDEDEDLKLLIHHS